MNQFLFGSGSVRLLGRRQLHCHHVIQVVQIQLNVGLRPESVVLRGRLPLFVFHNLRVQLIRIHDVNLLRVFAQRLGRTRVWNE